MKSRVLVFFVSLVLLIPTIVHSGGEPEHRLLIHALALRAGFTPQEAIIIAGACQSIDEKKINGLTTDALPHDGEWGPAIRMVSEKYGSNWGIALERALEAATDTTSQIEKLETKHHLRGRLWHALAPMPEKVNRYKLLAERTEIKADKNIYRGLVALGQELHFFVDMFMHPDDPIAGHLLFPGPLEKTQTRGLIRIFPTGHYRQTDMLTSHKPIIAQIIVSKAYKRLIDFKRGHFPKRIPGPGNIDLQPFIEAMNTAYRKAEYDPAILEPFVEELADAIENSGYQLDFGSTLPARDYLKDKMLFKFDEKGEMVSIISCPIKFRRLKAGNPKTYGSAEPDEITKEMFEELAKNMASKKDLRPGGISFSHAALQKLILGINIQSVAYVPETKTIVLVGPKSVFNISADLMGTALLSALATDKDRDIKFSLDPEDLCTPKTNPPFARTMRIPKSVLESYKIKEIRDGKLILEIENKPIDINDPCSDPLDVLSQGLEGKIKTPLDIYYSYNKYKVFTLRALDPKLDEIMGKNYYHRANFYNVDDIVRRTKFGQILYEADILIKELATGMVVLGNAGPRERPRVWQVSGYCPSIVLPSKERKIKGRLWFDYGDDIENVYTTAPLSQNKAVDLNEVVPNIFFRSDYSNMGGLIGYNQEDSIDLVPFGYKRLIKHLRENWNEYTKVYLEFARLTETYRAYAAGAWLRDFKPKILSNITSISLKDLEDEYINVPVYQKPHTAIGLGDNEVKIEMYGGVGLNTRYINFDPTHETSLLKRTMDGMRKYEESRPYSWEYDNLVFIPLELTSRETEFFQPVSGNVVDGIINKLKEFRNNYRTGKKVDIFIYAFAIFVFILIGLYIWEKDKHMIKKMLRRT